MITYVKIQGDERGDSREYRCAVCGSLISRGEDLVPLNGSVHHSFVNPSGIRCDFMTFVDCEAVLVGEQLFLEHSWFPGYGWRFLVCAGCRQHLGWQYDAVRAGVSPEHFFGVLKHTVTAGGNPDTMS